VCCYSLDASMYNHFNKLPMNATRCGHDLEQVELHPSKSVPLLIVFDTERAFAHCRFAL